MKMQDRESVKRMLTVIGTTLSWAFTSLLFLIFSVAVFHPSNQVLIDVNAYQEMGIESVLFAVIWITITVNMVLTWKGKSHNSNRENVRQDTQPVARVDISHTYAHPKGTGNYALDEPWYGAIEHILMKEEEPATEAKAITFRR